MPREISIRLGHDIVTGISRGLTGVGLMDAIREWERNNAGTSKYYKCVSIGIPDITNKRCPMENVNG